MINNYNDNLYHAQLPAEMLISATVNDIWVRDFGVQNLQGIKRNTGGFIDQIATA